CGERVEGLGQLRGVLTAALRDVVLAATAAAEHLRDGPYELTCAQALLARRGVRRDDHERAALRPAHDGDHGRLLAEARAHLESERAQVVRAVDLARVVAHEARPGRRRRRLLGDRPGRGEQLGLGERRKPLLGLLEARDEARDALGKLLGTRVEHARELVHERTLLGLRGVRPRTHERVDTTYARADRGLTEQGHQAERARALDVRARAQLARPVPADRHDAYAVAVLRAEQ